MLAIVLPTILAIFGFAWWFRAVNTRARYLPDWAYSGRIELVVWAIPALTIMLLGGVTWIGAHQLDPAAPVAGIRQAAADPGGVARLEMAVHLSRPEGRHHQHPHRARRRRRCNFELTSASVMNAFFIPQLGSMIYTMNGMTHAAQSAGRQAGRHSGAFGAFQRRRLFRHAFRGSRGAAGAIRELGGTTRAQAPQALDAASYRELREAIVPQRRRTSTGSTDPGLFDAIADPETAAGTRRAVRRQGCARRQPELPMLGKLSWAAIPFDQPIPMIASGASSRSPSWRPRLGRGQGPPALSVARVDHQRRSQAHRRDVHAAGPGDAAARLLRRDHDALAAGARVSRRRAFCRRSTTTRSSPRTAPS